MKTVPEKNEEDEEMEEIEWNNEDLMNQPTADSI